MSTATTSKPINCGQLSGEVGSWCSVYDDGTTRTITSGATQSALDSAIAAHVAIDEAANGATLRQQADGALRTNRDYLAITSPTNAQVAAQVKVLTQQNIRIIRLLLGKLDGTN